MKVFVAILTLSKEEHTDPQRQNSKQILLIFHIFKTSRFKIRREKKLGHRRLLSESPKRVLKKKFGVTQKTFCLVNPLEEFKCGQGLKPLPSRILR